MLLGPACPGTEMRLSSRLMKTNTVVLHLGWALIAGGAWWLGTRQGPRPAATADHPNARTEPGRLPTVRGVAPATAESASGSTVQVNRWLDPWFGANGRISPQAMTAAVTQALADPDPVRGLRHFTHLLACLTPENAPAALAALKAGSGRDPAAWTALFCSAWAATDGAGAMATLTESADQRAAMAGWAHHDPAAAAAWWKAQPAGPDETTHQALEASLVVGLARHDGATALAYIAAQPEGRRGELAKILAGEQLAHGAPATARWAMELPDAAMRGAALEAVARHYMAVDPAAGVAWASEIAPGPDTRDAVARVADRLAERNVQEALQWTQQLQPSPGRDEAYQQVFSEWARKDPTAGSEQLVRMPQGPERDSAIHSFSRILVNENPGDAIIWASAISDPVMRLDTQIDVARTWNASAPGAAASWIAGNLPPEAQRRALAPD